MALVGMPLAAEGQQEGQSDQPVKIGALMPMTGDLQAYGEADLRGPQLAAQQINAQGGVLGRELQIVVGDTQTSPQPGIEAAQRLVSVENVAGIVGALSSGVTIPVAESVTSEQGVVQISPASTSPVITDLEDNDYLFRTVPSDAFQGVALSELVNEAGYSNLSILYINNDYGEGLATSFQSAYEDSGGTIVNSLAYEGGNASYRGELQQLSSGNAEALVHIGYPENGITILRQSIEEGFFDEFVFTDGMKTPDIIEAIGAENLNGSFGSVPQAPTGTDAYQRFQSAYEEEHGEVPPLPYINTSYDAAFVLALAIQQAGSTDREAIHSALREVANAPGTTILPGQWEEAVTAISNGEDINYQGASGSVELDDNGDVTGTFAHWAIENGEIVTEKVFEPDM
jgi:ABC-type branched-subunit amino acid transport system substrate-binding protein